MSYTRCDVASWGGQEVRGATGTQFIPNADYVRCEAGPGNLQVVTYDWGTNAFMNVSVNGGFTLATYPLGPRRGNNSHCPRWSNSQGGILVFKIYASGDVYAGEHWRVGVDGVPSHRGTFDVLQGSTGIRDVNLDGAVQFLVNTNVWPGSSTYLPAGQQLLNWRERGDFVVGVMLHTFLGVSLFRKSDHAWFRPYQGNVDLLPGIADNGTVAASGADPGGFVPMSDWLMRPFDPFPIDPPDPTEPEAPRMISYNDPVEGFKPGELVKHPDGGAYYAIRKPNGYYNCTTPSGNTEERPNDGSSPSTYKPGSWERYRVSKNGASLIAEREGGKVYILPLVE